MDASAGTSGKKRQHVKKATERRTTDALAVQNGVYAAEKFSDSFSISHVLNLLVSGEYVVDVRWQHEMTRSPDDCLWISWVDREGVIFSSGFSFFKDLPLLLVLLLVLQRFGRRQWGYIPELATESYSVLLHPIDADGTPCKGEVAVNFYPEDKVHSGWALLGRATTVIGANQFGATKIDLAATVRREADEQQGENWRDFYRTRDDYQKAYQQAISATSTDYAPWFIIPADDKWFARLAIASVIHHHFDQLYLSYPKVSEAQKAELQRAKQDLLNEKAGGGKKAKRKKS